MNYHAYGLVLSSDIPLPGLTPASPSSLASLASLTIRHRTERVNEEGWHWQKPRPMKTEGPWLAVARQGRRHRLLFDGGADFVVSADEAEIVAHVEASASLDAARQRLVDQVVPLVMSHLGRFVLHAGAFATAHGAVALIGPAGAGKSTLSASFGLRGAPVIADDALFVEERSGEWLAVPSYAGLRVWPDVLPAIVAAGTADAASASPADKRRLTSHDGIVFAATPMPLRRVYMLQSGPACIGRLSPREAIMALIGHTFVLDIDDRERLAGNFARVSAASAALDVRTLTYPRELDALSLAGDMILADLSLR